MFCPAVPLTNLNPAQTIQSREPDQLFCLAVARHSGGPHF
jgi:hypothetical protein